MQRWDQGGRVAFTAQCLYRRDYTHLRRGVAVDPAANPPGTVTGEGGR